MKISKSEDAKYERLVVFTFRIVIPPKIKPAVTGKSIKLRLGRRL
jgi:hypothetical protein